MNNSHAYAKMIQMLWQLYQAEKITCQNMQETVNNMWDALQYYESTHENRGIPQNTGVKP